jgi:benzoylformate decarboxylase
MDVLDAPNAEKVVPTSILATRTVPEPALVTQAARLLAGAENPIVIVGDGVAFSEGQPELARVAELWGAAVWGADSSEVNLSAAHPHFRGLLGHMFAKDSQAITVLADAVLICGTYVFPEVFPALDAAFAPHARIVHIDLDTDAIANNFPVDLGLVSDPKLTLARLAESLEREMSSAQKQAATQRSHQLSADKRQNRMPSATLTGHAGMRCRCRPPGSWPSWLRWPPTTSSSSTKRSPPHPIWSVTWCQPRPGAYFQTRGGSLGVGVSGALELKLAHLERTVFGFTGDGGAMYTIQALWTAAHHQIGVKIVICNNRSYRILKVNIQQYWRERGLPEHDFPASFDLGDPELRFDRIAESLRVPAVRVETGSQVRPAIIRALETDGPFLIDLVIDGDVTHVTCGQ